jgi:rhodanese-related sulfurtransferase
VSAIDRYLARARARISVVDPLTAVAMGDTGALFVDTRPDYQRIASGTIPGAVPIERNHLEWRLDPTSEFRHPAVAAHRGAIVVYCQEGYSSTLAVAVLAELGLTDVHDLAGGINAWIVAGLPVVPALPVAMPAGAVLSG